MSGKREGWTRAFQSMFGQDAWASSEPDSGTGREECGPRRMAASGTPDPRRHKSSKAARLLKGREEATRARPERPPHPGRSPRLFIAWITVAGDVSASAARSACAPPGRSPSPFIGLAPVLARPGLAPGPVHKYLFAERPLRAGHPVRCDEGGRETASRGPVAAPSKPRAL